MAVATWPEDLPQTFDRESYSSGVPDNRIRSQSDVGPAKMRPRASRAAAPIRGDMVMSTSQKNDVLLPFIAEVGQGILPFWFPSQESGDPVLVRFDDGGLPAWVEFSPGYWRVSFKLEVLP